MSANILQVENLSASYGDENVLLGVSFAVPENSIVCLAGESGSGKTTVLRVIHSLSGGYITNGRILFRGVEISSMNDKESRLLLGKKIGLVNQDPQGAFNPLRSYEKQIRETLSSNQLPFDRRKVVELLQSMGLKDAPGILSCKPYELSIGMNQRMAVAASMLLDPDLLLCDEPTSALDVTSAEQVTDQLLNLNKTKGTAILMVTHDLSVAYKMADYIGIMKQGRMIEFDRKENIFHYPKSSYTIQLIHDIPKF